MVLLGLGLMIVGTLGTTALIGLDLDGTAPKLIAVLAGLGALALYHVGHVALSRGRFDNVETERVDALADDVEPQARLHLLENRAAELVRKIDVLERRRDETLVEMSSPRPLGSKHPSIAIRNPSLVVVPDPD